jgi:hypothetical protein
MHEPSEGHRRASLKAGSRSCGLRRHPIFDFPLKCRNAAERRTTPMRTPRPAQCRRASLATIHKPRALIASFDRLFLQPSLRAGRYSKRPPCLNLPHGIVESLLRHLPMRPILIGKPHVHHEGISVIGASYSSRAGLRFRIYRSERHCLLRLTLARELPCFFGCRRRMGHQRTFRTDHSPGI